MMMRIMMLLLAWLPFAASTEAAGILENLLLRKGPQAPPPMIKVLLAHDSPGVIIEVKGPYRLYDPRANSFISTRYLGKRNYMQALNDGLKWGEGFPGLHQLLIVPDRQTITTLVDGIEYRGSIYIYNVEGTINVVNNVDIEDYLHSVLAPQFRTSLSDETLAALAITARTNAYALAQNPKSPYWSINGKQTKYQGHAVSEEGSPIARAIDATRYLIMSSTGKDAEYATPFTVQWGPVNQEGNGSPQKAMITITQAEEMAKKGDHAAQILAKVFPGSSILLMHYAQPQLPGANRR